MKKGNVNNKRSTAFPRTIGVSFLALSVAISAHQPTLAQDSQPTTDAQDQESDAAQERDQIIVTGTRLANPEFAGVTPVQVLDPDKLELGGRYTAADFVRSSSLATGSFQIDSRLAGSSPGGSQAAGGAGVQGISLRGLGTNRTLVILNGRRLGPAGTRGQVNAVDLNVLPSAAIDRTEIVKSGSSSVYGADAIAGVVNVITKKNYDGGEVDLFGNVPIAGGGEQFFGSFNYGKTFDRGWVSVAGEYSKELSLRNKERDYTDCAEQLVFFPDTGARADITNPDTGEFYCFNHNPNGVIFNFNGGFGGTFMLDPAGELASLPGNDTNIPGLARTSNFNLPAGSAERRASYGVTNRDSAGYQNATVISPLERFVIFVDGEYELSDSATAYGSFLFNRRESEFDAWVFLFQGMAPDNPNNIFGQALLDASADFGFGGTARIDWQLVRPNHAEQAVNYYSGVAGLKGEFGGGFMEGWNWDAFVTYSRNEGKYGQTFLYEDRLNAISLGDTPCDPSFLLPEFSPASLCDGVNIPILSERFLVQQNWTAAEQAFLEGFEEGKTSYSQIVIEGTVAGDLFEMPAGTVSAVVGGTWRRDSIDDIPGPNFQASNWHLFSSAGRTKGSEKVKEVFGEVGIPLLSGQPFADDVDLVASARFTDYTISGSEFTYKAGVNWSVTPDIAVRGSYGTSFRGPNLFELFLADQSSFQFIADPCQEYDDNANAIVSANCASLGIPGDFVPVFQDAEVVAGGAIGPDGTANIKPETATSWSAGFILTPRDLGISLVAEYFSVEVKDEIDQLTANGILSNCFNDPDFPNNGFCNLINRNGTNPADMTQPFLIRSIDNRFLNIDSQTNRGVDMLLSANREIGGFDVTADMQAVYTLKDEIVRTVGETTTIDDRNGLTAEPKWSGAADLLIRRNDWTLFYRVDIQGDQGVEEFFGGNTFNFGGPHGIDLREILQTGVEHYHTISLSKQFEDRGLRVSLGAENIFDRKPPFVSIDYQFCNLCSGFRNGISAGPNFDTRGRRIFFNLNQKF